jgi:hypothetical protein
VESVVCVNPNSTSLEGVRNLNSGVEVGCVHSSSKSICSVVAETDGVFLVLEFGDRAYRAEYFFLHDGHVVLDVGEDGGFDEVAFGALALAAGDDSGAFVLAGLDVSIGMSVLCLEGRGRKNLPHDSVELELRNLRTLEGVGGEGVTDNVLLSTLLEALDKLVVDAFLHVDS